jgi:hypothetical protein
MLCILGSACQELRLVFDFLSVVLDNLPASRPEMVHKLLVVEYSVLIMDCLQRPILSILEKREEVRKFERHDSAARTRERS